MLSTRSFSQGAGRSWAATKLAYFLISFHLHEATGSSPVRPTISHQALQGTWGRGDSPDYFFGFLAGFAAASRVVGLGRDFTPFFGTFSLAVHTIALSTQVLKSSWSQDL